MTDSINTVDIGPECFGAVDGSVISWRGVNYTPQDATFTTLTTVPAAEHDDFAGVDVNDFVSTTTYGIFNDPQVWEPKFEAQGGPIPDTMREVILDTPLYTDEDAERALRHAKLTNEDRDRNGTLQRDGMVLIKRQVTLTSPWILDIDTDETGEWVKLNTGRVNLGPFRAK